MTIPDVLYKYRNWNDAYQKRILTDNEVFLASPDMFNDPFDATLPFRFNEEDLTPDNIFLKLVEIGRSAWPELSERELHERCYERQNSGVFQNGQYWKDEYENFKKIVNKTFGILSLTSKNDNLLMWSHYANSHTGFCVGFNKQSLFATIGGQIGPIIYSKQIPRVPLNDKTIGSITLLLHTKSSNWKYENEYRITKIYAPRKAFRLPNEAITEVVLGMKMKNEYKNEIIELIKNKLPHVRIYESHINLDEFKLDLIPIINI